MIHTMKKPLIIELVHGLQLDWTGLDWTGLDWTDLQLKRNCDNSFGGRGAEGGWVEERGVREGVKQGKEIHLRGMIFKDSNTRRRQRI